MRSSKPAQDPGLAWLSQFKDDAELQLNGAWKSYDWGTFSFNQEEGKKEIKGKTDEYDIIGTVSGTDIYLVLYYKSKVNFTMILKPFGTSQLLGEYTKGIMKTGSKKYAVTIDPFSNNEKVKMLPKAGNITSSAQKAEGLLTFNLKLIDTKTAAIDSSVTKETTNIKEIQSISKEMVNNLIKDYAPAQKKDRLAIIPASKNKTINRMVLFVEDQIVASKFFIVIERAAIDKILKEQAFSSSAVVDDKQTVQLGKLLGANKIVLIKMIDE